MLDFVMYLNVENSMFLISWQRKQMYCKKQLGVKFNGWRFFVSEAYARANRIIRIILFFSGTAIRISQKQWIHFGALFPYILFLHSSNILLSGQCYWSSPIEAVRWQAFLITWEEKGIIGGIFSNKDFFYSQGEERILIAEKIRP